MGLRFFTLLRYVQNDMGERSPLRLRKGVRGMFAWRVPAPASPAISLRLLASL